MPYVIENLTQYDLSEQDTAILEGFGLIFHNPEPDTDDPEARETTALVWDDLGLQGDSAFLLFDVILGRETP